MKRTFYSILLILILLVIISITVILTYNFVRLWRFKRCLDNNFEMSYCKYYEDY